MGAGLSRLGQGSAVCAHVVGREAVDVGEPFLNQAHGVVVEPLEIIGCEKHLVLPVEAEPADIVLNGLHIFRIFRGRVGIIHAEMADAAWNFHWRCRS
jgi:hypothetical protein